jgi:protein Xni
MAITVLLVDALNLIRRVDAAQRDGMGGKMSGSAVDSSVQSLRRALKECAPTHAVCVFEGHGRSFRHDLFPQYKTGRPPMPADLEESLPAIREGFLQAGVKSIEPAGWEADDVIATLACKVESRGGGVVILSTDKIFLQLLSGLVRVRDHFGKRDLDETHVREKFGVAPHQLVDLLALAGDPTNTIPGVPGVGTKTAFRLLGEHQCLENILSHAPALGNRLGQSIAKHEDEALLFRRLLQLRRDIDLGLNLQTFRLQP